MNDFKTHLAEGALSTFNLPRLITRERGRGSTQMAGYRDSQPVGWFNTKDNRFGFVIHELDAGDKAWFKSEKQSTTNVFRFATDKSTGLVKLDFTKGKYTLFDNAKYEASDRIQWMRPYQWLEFHVDGESKSYNVLGLKPPSSWARLDN